MCFLEQTVFRQHSDLTYTLPRTAITPTGVGFHTVRFNCAINPNLIRASLFKTFRHGRNVQMVVDKEQCTVWIVIDKRHIAVLNVLPRMYTFYYRKTVLSEQRPRKTVASFGPHNVYVFKIKYYRNLVRFLYWLAHVIEEQSLIMYSNSQNY